MKIAVLYNYPLHYREAIFALLDKKYDIDFFFGDRLSEKIKAFDVKCLKGFKGIKKNIIINNRVIWRTGTVGIAFKNYDKYLIISEFHNVSLWIFLIILKIRRKEIYGWSHGWYGREGFINKQIKKIFFSLHSGNLVYGEYAKNLMMENGVDKRKIHVIYNSLNYDKQVSVRKTLKLTEIYKKKFNNNDPVIIFSGRITRIKKLEMLIDAHHIIKKYNVIIIGDGEQKKYLEKKIKEFGLENRYWFYGSCYEEIIIAELYFNADICVSPGNVGLTAMHAMVYGCPVITHSDFKNQMPEFEAIDNGITGDYFENNNVISLAKCIEKWLSQNSDKREYIRAACYRKIDKYYNPVYQMSVFESLLKNKIYN